MAPLQIERPLQDITTEENSSVVFEFKIGSNIAIPTIEWHKNGVLIEPSDKYTMTSNEDTYQLKISSVTMEDYGIYHAISSEGMKRVQTKAALHVKHNNNLYMNGGCLYFRSPRFEEIAPVRHISDQIIESGRSIQLEFELQLKNSVDSVANFSNTTQFVWYTSNLLVNTEDQRIAIINNSNSSYLLILNARDTDTGIYHVMAKTELGILSSMAHVVVNTKRCTKQRLPFIEELLPEEVECIEFEDVKIMCKVRTDVQTVIRWTKNGTEIVNDEKFKREDCGNGYIGLRIRKIGIQDAAGYTLSVRNALSDVAASTSCFINVSECYEAATPVAELIKPLDAAVACFGSQVTLKCSFDLNNFKYFYVIWRIGRYKVERTNHLFTVENYNGDFFLSIKSLQADMAGEISCELRRAYPNRISVFVANTTANLAIVPPAFMDKEINLHLALKPKYFYLTPLNVAMQSKTVTPESLSAKMKKLRINFDDPRKMMKQLLRTRPPSDPLEIIFCRTDDDHHSFVNVTKRSLDINADSLIVFNKNEGVYVSTNDPDLSQKAVIKWDALKVTTWFAIHILLPNGEVLGAGLTSKPEFEVRNPPTERMLKFRITAVRHGRGESSVSILPPMDTTPRSCPICGIKTMQEFAVQYAKTGEKIGSGAFGTVGLVKNTMGEYYAAKTLKTKTRKRRETAMREYDIMKTLFHPKVIELVDVFVSRDSVVFVMDYLWGGELFDRIAEEEYIKEVDVIFYIRQILEGLEYLHSKRIAHLDLKPENIMCVNPNSRLIRLIDMGLARVLDDDNVTRAIYGTRDYVAPEVLNYDRLTVACDMWSLGVVTYMLLSGVMPFAGETWPQRCSNITRARYNYDDPAFRHISEMAKNFINRLLVLYPGNRMDATLALTHKWITHGPPKESRPRLYRTMLNLKSYLAVYRARWQRAGNVLIAAHRLRTQVLQRSAAESETATLPVT